MILWKHNIFLYIPLRSDKTASSAVRFQTSIPFISHYVQIKQTHYNSKDKIVLHLYIPLRSDKTLKTDTDTSKADKAFISHYVQIKLILFRILALSKQLYIPLRSDKTIFRNCFCFGLFFFISHYVQIKPLDHSPLLIFQCSLYPTTFR